MNRLLIILVLSLSSACGNTRSALSPAAETSAEQAPSWVTQRPQLDGYYIGIGKALKSNPLSALPVTAKELALEDLASGIEVQVTASSILYTLEHDERFTETYRQTINTSTSLELSGFDAYDSYQDDRYNYVYYRLSKADYQRYKEQKKREAMSSAESFLDLAVVAHTRADVAVAAENYANALIALAAYRGEENLGAQGNAVDLASLEGLYSLSSEFALEINPAGTLTLNEDNQFTGSVVLKAILGAQEVQPIEMTYTPGNEKTLRAKRSRWAFTLHPQESKKYLLKVTADPYGKAREAIKGQGLGYLMAMLSAKEQEIEVQTIYPPIRVSASMTDTQGQRSDAPMLAAAMTKRLTGLGIAIDRSGTSDYHVHLDTRSRDGGMVQAFQVVYSDMTVTAEHVPTASVRYSTEVRDVKGVHRDLDNAQGVSSGKCAEAISKELVKALISAIY